MDSNPTLWLSSTADSCCQKFFGFKYDNCIGRYPPDNDDCNIKLFYPDWEGANAGCANDGKQNQSYIARHLLFECLYQWQSSHVLSPCMFARQNQALSPITC